jgi:hypothetical protein
MDQRNNPTRTFAALNVAGQMGCLMLFMALGALGLGLVLDNTFGTRRIFTLICVIISVPINLGFTLFLTQRLIRRIIPPDKVKTEHDDAGPNNQ